MWWCRGSGKVDNGLSGNDTSATLLARHSALWEHAKGADVRDPASTPERIEMPHARGDIRPVVAIT
jgi:hypothetical protein